MINILVLKQNSNIVAIELNGHSGYAPAGQDIVCSAVSTLAQNLELSLTNLLGIKPVVKLDEELPLYSVSLPEGVNSTEAQLLFKSCVLGLKDIANQYKKYISIKEKNK